MRLTFSVFFITSVVLITTVTISAVFDLQRTLVPPFHWKTYECTLLYTVSEGMSEYAGRDPRRLTFVITSFIRADMNFHESLKNEKKIYSMLS